MIVKTIRPYTEQEQKVLIRQLPSRYKRVEGFIMKFVFTSMILLLPGLWLDKHYHFSSTLKIWSAILPLVGAGAIAFWLTKKYEGGFSTKSAYQAIKTGQAEVSRVTASRAIEREDPEDFGKAFYLAVQHEGRGQVLYMQGQYLDELDEGYFPATEFEVVRRTDSGEVVALTILGQALKPEKVLPAFAMQEWQAGNTPADGSILLIQMDDLI